MILDDLNGKRVLVTGSSAGIGAAIARSFHEHGADVAIHYFRGETAARALAREMGNGRGKVALVSGDVRKLEDAASLVEQTVRVLGGIDVLVNNAGGMVKQVKLTDYADEVFGEVVDLNMRSILAVTRAAIAPLKASQGGSIINIGSIAGRNGGAPGSALYAATKAAVHSLTRGMALEFAADGVRVNAVAPGLMLTRFHENTSKDRLESVRLTIPLRRLGTAEDCAGACLFLASSAMSGYVTGQIIDVNGGRLMP